jgi:hypothetical protein
MPRGFTAHHPVNIAAAPVDASNPRDRSFTDFIFGSKRRSRLELCMVKINR